MQIGISAFLQGQTKMSKTDKKQLHTVMMFSLVLCLISVLGCHATKIRLKIIFSAGIKTP